MEKKVKQKDVKDFILGFVEGYRYEAKKDPNLSLEFTHGYPYTLKIYYTERTLYCFFKFIFPTTELTFDFIDDLSTAKSSDIKYFNDLDRAELGDIFMWSTSKNGETRIWNLRRLKELSKDGGYELGSQDALWDSQQFKQSAKIKKAQTGIEALQDEFSEKAVSDPNFEQYKAELTEIKDTLKDITETSKKDRKEILDLKDKTTKIEQSLENEHETENRWAYDIIKKYKRYKKIDRISGYLFSVAFISIIPVLILDSLSKTDIINYGLKFFSGIFFISFLGFLLFASVSLFLIPQDKLIASTLIHISTIISNWNDDLKEDFDFYIKGCLYRINEIKGNYDDLNFTEDILNYFEELESVLFKLNSYIDQTNNEIFSTDIENSKLSEMVKSLSLKIEANQLGINKDQNELDILKDYLKDIKELPIKEESVSEKITYYWGKTPKLVRNSIVSISIFVFLFIVISKFSMMYINDPNLIYVPTISVAGIISGSYFIINLR